MSGHACTVTLSNPGRKNAITRAMTRELGAALREIALDDSIRVAVIEGEGGDFSAGGDLSEQRPANWMTYLREVAATCLALHACAKPVIAKVRGVAVGAGAGIALGCDLIVASDNARFGTPFVARAMTPDYAVSYLLPRLVGLHRAKELALLGEIHGAAEAQRLGIVNHVVPDSGLDAWVEAWVARLAALPPIAVMTTKGLLNASPSSTLGQALEAEAVAQVHNMSTSDVREARVAWRERRPGRYEGR